MNQSLQILMACEGLIDSPTSQQVYLDFDFISLPEKPIALVCHQKDLVGAVGYLTDFVVSDKNLFGRLEFYRDRDSIACENLWLSGTLTKKNATMQITIENGFDVPNDELFRGELGPFSVATIWTIDCAILQASIREQSR